MNRILGVRHAQSTGNVDTSRIQGRSNHLGITRLGEQQAATVGVWLKRVYGIPDAVVASPARRAVRTAQIALGAANLQLDIALSSDLQELSQGDWEGAVRAEKFTPAVRQRMADEGMDYKSPGGESLQDVQTRMQSAMEALPEGKVWVFGHGLAFRCLTGALRGWGHSEIIGAQAHMYNTSVTEFNRTDAGPSLGRFAMVAHLPPELLTI